MQLPKGKDLYDILKLTKDQVKKDESIVKKAYRKLALEYHPDKQTSKTAQQVEESTQQFLLVGYAYSILSDSEKRNHYDLTGGFDELDAFFSGGKDWTSYFKTQWQGVVSADTIQAHALKYQGSAEEEEDVLHYYTLHKGNMNKILAQVEHSKATDVNRFMELIQTAINNNIVDSFPAYARTTSKTDQMRRLKREKEEAASVERETMAKKKSKDKMKQQQNDSDHSPDEIQSSAAEEETDNDDADDDNDDDDKSATLDSLEDTISARQRQRASKFDEMLANLEKKATSRKKKGTGNKGKGKDIDSATENTGNDSLSTNIDDCAPIESTTSVSTTTSDNDNKEKDVGHKDSRTTITTRSMTKKRTKQTRTKTTTSNANTDSDADSKTTTTSVIIESKKLTKVDRKKRKHGNDQGGTDNKNDSNKKAKKIGSNKGEKTNILEKPRQRTRSQRRKSTKKSTTSA